MAQKYRADLEPRADADDVKAAVIEAVGAKFAGSVEIEEGETAILFETDDVSVAETIGDTMVGVVEVKEAEQTLR